MDKATFFILNIFLNSFLVFLTVTILVESLIFVFRIGQGRFAAILRMSPLIKLTLDLGSYDFSKWSYVYGINPLQVKEGSRTLSITLNGPNQMGEWFFLPINPIIQLTTMEGFTFTLADLVGYSLSPFLLNAFSLGLLTITLGVVIRKFFLYRSSLKILHTLARYSKPCLKKIDNLNLSSALNKHRVKIRTSDCFSGSPFVSGLISSVIYIPIELLQSLTTKEFEAVLAHEIEHVHYKDGFVRLCLDLVGSIFWWIPTNWLRRRIEEGQEVGCDLQSLKYGVDPADLATAIYKSAQSSIRCPKSFFIYSLAKNTTLKRVHLLLLDPTPRFRNVYFVFQLFIFGVTFLMISLGRFWIF